MKVSFRFKFGDLVAFNFFHIFRSTYFLGFIIFIIILGTILNWQTVNKVAYDKSLGFRLVMLIILDLMPIVFLYLFIGLGLVISNIGKMNKTVLTDSSIILNDDVIITETKYLRSEVKWSAVQKLARTRTHIFMYVLQHGALTIPRRAFTNDEAYEQFWSACRAKVKV